MITEQQLQDRYKDHRFGGSDVAAICGWTPKWRTPADVVLEMTRRVKPKAMTDDMRLGHELEPIVLNRMEEQLGPIERDTEVLVEQISVDGYPVVKLHEDGRVVATNETAEVKTSGVKRGFVSDDWGDFGTDDVPPHALAQPYCGMIHRNSNCAHVGAFLGGRGIGMYQIWRSEALVERIISRITGFWKTYIRPWKEEGRLVLPPDDPSVGVVDRMERDSDGPPELIAEEVWQRFVDIREAKRELDRKMRKVKADYDAAKAKIGASIGFSKSGTTPSGQTFDWKTIKNGGYTVEPFEYHVIKERKD